jgi:hypothetical protein
VSRTTTVGSKTGDQKRAFFLYQNVSTSMTAMATSWAKVAFAITLTRLVRTRTQTVILWVVIATANLVLVPGMLSIWIPACIDPRARFRPVNKMCFDLKTLQYLGGTTIGKCLLPTTPHSQRDMLTCALSLRRCRGCHPGLVPLDCGTETVIDETGEGWTLCCHESRCHHRRRHIFPGLLSIRTRGQ